MKTEKRIVLRSKDCPQGRLFEEGEEIPKGWARQLHELKSAPKKKVAKKKAK